MDKSKKKIKSFSKTALFCASFVILIFILSFWFNIAKAAWDEPSAEPPLGNIYTPLNIGPDYQAKKGRLLLDPFYNPEGVFPSISKQLEVKGPDNAYINYFDITNTLTVDTDTLYVGQDSSGSGIVGIGTASPGTQLEISNGTVNIGSAISPVSDEGIVSSGSTATGVYGRTLASDKTSVLGYSSIGTGVYGLNTSSGFGIYAESGAVTAVRGLVTAVFGDPVIAGLYAQAKGLGAWAGYFAGSVYSTEAFSGSKFLANRLSDSQIPYTVGWQKKVIDSSQRVRPAEIAFDGDKLWVSRSASGWYPDIDIIDPVTGSLDEEIRIQEVGSNINEMIYAGGYIWTANLYNDDVAVTRVDPVTRAVGNYDISNDAGVYDGAADIIYDGLNGGQFVWAVSGDATSKLVKFDANNPGSPLVSIDLVGQCPTYNYNLCNDTIDNDGDTFINNADPDCVDPPSYIDPATVGGAPGSVYESIELGDLGYASSLDFDGTYLWVGMRGYRTEEGVFVGEGIIRVNSSPPYNQDVYCLGPAHNPEDIAYGNGKLWIGTNNDWRAASYYMGSDFDGFMSLDPALYDSVTGAGLTFYPLAGGIFDIKYDDISSGSPYVWVSNNDYFGKRSPADGSEVLSYSLPGSNLDFEFDRSSGSEDYAWVSHEYAGSISRNPVNDANGSSIFIIKGSASGDVVFDGTYIWSANLNGNSVAKYRAEDGFKIGNYQTGWYPRHLIYDGESIWVLHGNRGTDTTDLTQLDAATGESVGSYDYTASTNTGDDAVFDGINIWVSDTGADTLRKINTSTIGLTSYDVSADIDGPYHMVFDGENIWVTHLNACSLGNNCFSKVDSSGNVVATYRLTDAKDIAGNLSAIEFDGAYLWLGVNEIDAEGYNLFQVRPSDGSVVNKYKVYITPGTCSGGDRAELYCSDDSQCAAGGGTCRAKDANIREIYFDGLHLWTAQAYASGGGRECDDDIDNDGDGFIDRDTGVEDPECEDTLDLHEGDSSSIFGTTTDIECSDGIDNDGNGRCDFDGAVGSPGCSGKPDSGCSSASDISEATTYQSIYLSRIVPATGQMVESIPYGWCYTDRNVEIAFDGNNIWLNEEDPLSCGSGGSNYELIQYYSGQGSANTDQSGLVTLQSRWPGDAQPNSFSLSGSVNFGNQLKVVGDLVVQNNVWGGDTDILKDFGKGCDNGQFVKGFTKSIFGDKGVLTGSSVTWAATDVVTRSDYLYIVGFDSTVDWRIEKRSRVDGSLDPSFGTSGIVTSDSASFRAQALVKDTGAMYIVGEDESPDWRIEKRSLTDGSLDTSFGTNGVITSDFLSAVAEDIVKDGSYLYIGGTTSAGNDWRIEKRQISNGSLDPFFGTGGVITGASGNESLTALAKDDSYLYAVGYDSSPDWRIEKRSLTDGSLDTGFGTGGVVTGAFESSSAEAIAIDSAYMYVGGNDDSNNWRIEKRSLTDGSLDVSFGTGGIATGDATSQRILDLKIYSDYMYISGYDDSNNWRIEKRSLTDGSLDVSFGTDGVVTGEASTNVPYALSVDAENIFVVGSNDSLDWRTEKRSLADGDVIIAEDFKLQCRPL